MTSLRCLRLMPFLLCAAMAAAGCAADGSASGELPGSIGNGKTDGLGVEDGSELQTAALTLINFASRRTLVTEVGLAEGAAAAVEAARPVATLASLETNAAVGTPAAEGLVELAAAHLDTGGLPPCVPGTIAGTSDGQASKRDAQRLSEQRAESVRAYMIKRGIDGDRLTTRGGGAGARAGEGRGGRARGGGGISVRWFSGAARGRHG